MRKLISLSVLAVFCTLTSAAYAGPATSGLPLPRFVSLRSDQVNLRRGPGTQYPVDWLYIRKDLPVEIIAEFENWRKIRDWEGTEGWVHRSLLSGRRTLRVTGIERFLRSEPFEDARPVARIESGVIGRLEECLAEQTFCEVEIADKEGYLKRGEFWGIYDGEVIP